MDRRSPTPIHFSVASLLAAAFFAVPVVAPAIAQAPAEPGTPVASLAELQAELGRIEGIPTSEARERAIDDLWGRLETHGQIPYAEATSVVFLHRDTTGSVREVALRGDMNQWRLSAPYFFERLGESSLFVLEASFPVGARLDYKLFLDGRQWMQDFANPHVQVGGFGPNSELRMPGWSPPPEIEERDGPKGTLGPRQTLDSPLLTAAYAAEDEGGLEVYAVAYRVYTPADYGEGTLRDLPLVVFTDGQDYAHPQMGRATTVLDNAIADGTVPPLVAVFVDPRHPRTENNRRERELFLEPEPFARFLGEELIPHLDARLRTQPAPEARVLVGTSLGGLFALGTVARFPQVFGRALVQSPALFWDDTRFDGRLRRQVEAGSAPIVDGEPARVFLDLGRFFDNLEQGRQVAELLREKGWAVRVVEADEGHSWGHWRRFLDDGLGFLLGPSP